MPLILTRKRYGNVTNVTKHVISLSDIVLSDIEESVWALGYGFSIPKACIKREEVFAEFELIFAQLSPHNPISND